MKDFTVVVESFKGSIEGVERIFSEDILMCDVTEVEECIEGFDDVHVYMAFKCIHKDLERLRTFRRHS